MTGRRRPLVDDRRSRSGGRGLGRRRIAAAVGLLLAALAVVEILRPFHVLRVQVLDDARAATTVLTFPARDSERFEVRYVHSYNHFNVREFFEQAPDGRGAVVVDQYLDGNGAGIGETPGETVLVDVGNGWERVTGLHRTLDGPLKVRIGAVANHELVHRCRGVALADVGAPHSLAEIGWAPAGTLALLRAELALALAEPVGDSCAVPGGSSS